MAYKISLEIHKFYYGSIKDPPGDGK